MAVLVCNGAVCKCSYGTIPCTLKVTSNSNSFCNNKPIATVMDNTSANLSTFGMCSSMSNPAVSEATTAAQGVLTPQKCSPVLTSQWTRGSSSVRVSNKPALNSSSKLRCQWAGEITIEQPGQKKAVIS